MFDIDVIAGITWVSHHVAPWMIRFVVHSTDFYKRWLLALYSNKDGEKTIWLFCGAAKPKREMWNSSLNNETRKKKRMKKIQWKKSVEHEAVDMFMTHFYVQIVHIPAVFSVVDTWNCMQHISVCELPNRSSKLAGLCIWRYHSSHFLQK